MKGTPFGYQKVNAVSAGNRHVTIPIKEAITIKESPQ